MFLPLLKDAFLIWILYVRLNWRLYLFLNDLHLCSFIHIDLDTCITCCEDSASEADLGHEKHKHHFNYSFLHFLNKNVNGLKELSVSTDKSWLVSLLFLNSIFFMNRRSTWMMDAFAGCLVRWILKHNLVEKHYVKMPLSLLRLSSHQCSTLQTKSRKNSNDFEWFAR